MGDAQAPRRWMGGEVAVVEAAAHPQPMSRFVECDQWRKDDGRRNGFDGGRFADAEAVRAQCSAAPVRREGQLAALDRRQRHGDALLPAGLDDALQVHFAVLGHVGGNHVLWADAGQNVAGDDRRVLALFCRRQRAPSPPKLGAQTGFRSLGICLPAMRLPM